MVSPRIWVLVCCLAANVAHAEQWFPCKGDANLTRRCLGGHQFIPSRILVAPFLTTDFGAGLLAQTGSTLEVGSKPPKNHGGVGGGLNFGLQVAISEWISLLGAFSATVYSGLGPDAVLFGSGANLDYNLGVRFRLAHSKKFLLSTSAKLIGQGISGIKPIDLAMNAPHLADATRTCLTESPSTDDEKKAVEAACRKIQNSILKYSYDLGAQLDLSMAVGFSPIFGLFGNVSYVHYFRDPKNPLDFSGRVVGGLGLSLDISPITPVPLGFVFGWQYAYRFDYRTAFDLHVGALTLVGGIFYTGSRYFSAGIEVTDEITPVLAGEAPAITNLFSANVSVRYYWN